MVPACPRSPAGSLLLWDRDREPEDKEVQPSEALPPSPGSGRCLSGIKRHHLPGLVPSQLHGSAQVPAGSPQAGRLGTRRGTGEVSFQLPPREQVLSAQSCATCFPSSLALSPSLPLWGMVFRVQGGTVVTNPLSPRRGEPTSRSLLEDETAAFTLMSQRLRFLSASSLSLRQLSRHLKMAFSELEVPLDPWPNSSGGSASDVGNRPAPPDGHPLARWQPHPSPLPTTARVAGLPTFLSARSLENEAGKQSLIPCLFFHLRHALLMPVPRGLCRWLTGDTLVRASACFSGAARLGVRTQGSFFF